MLPKIVRRFEKSKDPEAGFALSIKPQSEGDSYVGATLNSENYPLPTCCRNQASISSTLRNPAS